MKTSSSHFQLWVFLSFLNMALVFLPSARIQAAVAGATVENQPRAPDGTQHLRGHVPAGLPSWQPIGRLGATDRLKLAIGLPLRNPESLARFLEQLHNPAHPNYRHYLTPEEFAARFGPTEQDYAAVVAFAQANRLSVNSTHPNRILLDVSGNVADIEKALHVTLHVYRHPTEARTFYAPEVEPSVNLAVPILKISGLDNYSRPRPRLQATPLGQQPAAAPKAGSGPSGTYMGNDFRAAYVPGSPLTGAGQTVGLVQFDGYAASDIADYESQAGLPSVSLNNVLLDGFSGSPTGSGGELEVCLDIEAAISMAPGLAGVIVYMAGPAGNFDDVLNRMATDNLAKQLSCSWYLPGGGADAVADQIFQQMAAQGQSFFNASGDHDAFTGPVDFPEETPFIVQVGGTTLTTSGPAGAWASEKVWNWGSLGSGGGISTRYTIPSYQAGINMTLNRGSTAMRNIPDVALTADNVYVRADGRDYNVGGTSCAAPLWAGFTALVNEQAVASGRPVVGFINAAVAAIGADSSCFHDITTGDNTSPSSPSEFYAVGGYDLCTGWGTPAGQNLIDALATPDALLISPSSLVFSGLVGGPFSPNPGWLILSNTGSNILDWTATSMQPWVSVDPASGSISPGSSNAVSVWLTAAANILLSGDNLATLMFSNTASGAIRSRSLVLELTPPEKPFFSLDTDPGWPREGEWQFGLPAGLGGTVNGYPDPSTAASGTNVFGVNLNGDYSLEIGGPYFLTAGPFDFSGYTEMTLRFLRWLNSDFQPYVYDTIEVSPDGTNWNPVWDNGTSEIADDAWIPESYDISAWADNQTNVYVRWGYRVASPLAFAYSGWNIDDIGFLGNPSQQLRVSVPSVVNVGTGILSGAVSAYPAPTNDLMVVLTSSDAASRSRSRIRDNYRRTKQHGFQPDCCQPALRPRNGDGDDRAATPNYVAGSANIQVLDDAAVTLNLSLPGTAIESQETLEGEVYIRDVQTNTLLVQLSSSDTTILQVPDSIFIPVGQTTAAFAATIVDNNMINGP